MLIQHGNYAKVWKAFEECSAWKMLRISLTGTYQVRTEREPWSKNIAQRYPTYIAKCICLFPYKVNIFQRIEHVNLERGLEYANWCLQNLESCSFFLHRIIFSEVIGLHVTREVDKRSAALFGTKSCHETHNMSTHSNEMTVWNVLPVIAGIAPYYLVDSMVDWEGYLLFSSQYFLRSLQRISEQAFFIHDGVSAHYSSLGRQLSDSCLPAFWTGSADPIVWPSCLPDLLPFDFLM